MTACISTVFCAGAIAWLLKGSSHAGMTESERAAMAKMEGQVCVVDGQTNVVGTTGPTWSFLTREDIRPHLELIVEESERCNWKQSDPIRFAETDDFIIVTWPSQPELLGLTIYWGSAYRKELVIDKKTGKVISIKCG